MPFLRADGTIVEPALASVCILYDPADGSIMHRHEVITLPGAPSDEPQEVESTAYRLAASLGHDISRLNALHVAPEEYVSHKYYAVDTAALRLIEKAGSPFEQGGGL